MNGRGRPRLSPFPRKSACFRSASDIFRPRKSGGLPPHQPSRESASMCPCPASQKYGLYFVSRPPYVPTICAVRLPSPRQTPFVSVFRPCRAEPVKSKPPKGPFGSRLWGSVPPGAEPAVATEPPNDRGLLPPREPPASAAFSTAQPKLVPPCPSEGR